ncbi:MULTISPECIES: SO2930 family diheme c-type cytochrome [unclassified Novosphingobium]|uniref:SO2930 family diheme c-type cytochrome n=1 Tax=unclassified Novosphingobium TaxID=2644732 RepID=UPI0025CE291F|nr:MULTISPECIES: SO2930 family diheme c-type cytochrome [unclassified Novosphingobium]HQV04038.1 SO2930 family diheme c-type cytochrome [Novosphingobium sp.]
MRMLAAALLIAGASIPAAETPRVAAVNNAAIVQGGNPAKLSAFGFFADAKAQRPASGVTPYRLNTPLWSDGSEKLRFVYVPAGKRALTNGDGLLNLPVGSALIKTFKLEGRLIETRVLLHRADGWVALPYQWNADQSDARLVLAGARLDARTPAGEAISYAIPNKNQCKECHALGGEVTPIGPKARNLSAAWLADFAKADKLDKVPKVTRRVPLWEDRDKVPVADAARGYLDANCAHCHNPQGAASNSGLFLAWEVTDRTMLGIGKRPVAAGRGSGGLEFGIVPGKPEQSILYHRMASLEGGVSMPEVGRASLDRDGLAVVHRWIEGLR